jgi:ATP-dependent Clp protease ATP-binding subunit ClpC
VLENYSPRAQDVVVAATEEARLLGHAGVGTEHLLLGLLAEDDGVPAEVLRTAGATFTAARHKVAEVVGGDGTPPDDGDLALTPRAKRALDRASRFARQDREPEVTTGHVLLGVLDVEGLACQVLRGLDVDVAQVREAVVAARTEVVPPRPSRKRSSEKARPRCPSCRAFLDDVLAETTVAARRDGQPSGPVNVVHCLACGTTLGVVPSRPD